MESHNIAHYTWIQINHRVDPDKGRALNWKETLPSQPLYFADEDENLADEEPDRRLDWLRVT